MEHQEEIWEDQIALNSIDQNSISVKYPSPMELWLKNGSTSEGMPLHGYDDAIERDTAPIPAPDLREGYFADDDAAYWLSGLGDTERILARVSSRNMRTGHFFDFGCATGRVMRHVALQSPFDEISGGDINAAHVAWNNLHLPKKIKTFQMTSIPTIPLRDSSVDVLTAYSVFTHIENFETTWLAEIYRVLRPNGLAYVTVQTERVLSQMNETWPVVISAQNHRLFAELSNERLEAEGRIVLRFNAQRSYSSHVFIASRHIEQVWGRFFGILEIGEASTPYHDGVWLVKD